MIHNYKLALAALFFLIIYYLCVKITAYRAVSQYKREHGCLAPKQVPQFERILGLGVILDLRRNVKAKTQIEFFNRLFETYGRTWTVSFFGQTFLLTAEPENIKAVLATQFEDFGVGPREYVFGALLGKGIFVVDGAAWQHSRALIRPAFTKAQVAELDFFESHLQKLIAKIPKDGSTVDLGPLFFCLTFDVATDFLFGESANSLESEEGSKQRQFGAAFDYATSKLGSTGSYGWLSPLFYYSKFHRSCRFVNGFIAEFVDKALKEQKKNGLGDEKLDTERDEKKHKERYVFLNEVAKATSDPIQIRDEAASIMLAGRDTTASLLITTFHILSRRPDVWERLQSEISELDGEAPDYETLRNMKYLKWVINESLRLYPVVPGNSRQANKNTTIPRGGGPDGKSPVFIPKDAIVSYQVSAMHKDPLIYGEDADEFKPERWENLRTGWDYLPFNGGPRICIGQQFALTEASYTIVRLLQHFPKIESRDPLPWQETFGLTATNSNGAKVSLTPA